MLEQDRMISHFKIIRQLGAGGMGEVYLAEDQKLHRKVALKVLTAERFDDSSNLERFKREARTAAQISHPNVTSIYEIGSEADSEAGSDIEYIVMEYVEGKDLSTYIQGRNLEMNGLIRLAEKITSGLSAAHKLNIVHRDIKADNILVGEDGEPKILDFGLAKPVDTSLGSHEDNETATISRELTKVGKIVGTVSYMSPEQARGDKVDIRSDIFSFGTLLYRMVTGEFPFSGLTQMGTLAKIIETRQESPTLKNENIPAELERIIDKCLQKNPDDRYQDSRELLVDLRNLRRQFDSGITDTISGVTARMDKKKSYTFQLKGKAAIAVAAILVLALVAAWSFKDSDRLPSSSGIVAKENSMAILGFENKTGDPELDWLETGLPEIMLTDLAQSEAINLISLERILDCFTDDKKTSHTYEQCRNAAKSIGAVSILSGSFYKMGDKTRIDARLEDIATGNIIFAEKVVGDDPFSLVDSLTAKIVASLNLESTMGGNQSVSTFTSSSPVAYRLYREGMELFRKQLLQESIDKFNEALKIDSTFALPYMRIGMSYVFLGRPQQGVSYFGQANKYSEKLPVRDKTLLDIYSDVWVNQQWSDAYAKMKAFVENYPDDKEVRTIYALLLNVFAQDTTAAFANLDTALLFDPTYQFALSEYSDMLRQAGSLDRAMELSQRLKKYHPDSPEGYQQLSRLYSQQEKYEQAAAEQEEALKLFPNRPEILQELSTLYLKTREFDKVDMYLRRMERESSDDPFQMMACYGRLANLSNWQGKFNKGMDYRFRVLDEALKSGDSARIHSGYSTITVYYQRFDNDDSALYYLEKGRFWANRFSSLNYPLTIVDIDYTRADEVSEAMTAAVERFRSVVPSEFWATADALQEIFDAKSKADTVELLAALEKIVAAQAQGNNMGNARELGVALVNYRRYDEAIEILEPMVQPSGVYYASSYAYFIIHYKLGIAYQETGQTERAAESFRTVLKYWGEADLQLDEIKDARSRLASLTG